MSILRSPTSPRLPKEMETAPFTRNYGSSESSPRGSIGSSSPDRVSIDLTTRRQKKMLADMSKASPRPSVVGEEQQQETTRRPSRRLTLPVKPPGNSFSFSRSGALPPYDARNDHHLAEYWDRHAEREAREAKAKERSKSLPSSMPVTAKPPPQETHEVESDNENEEEQEVATPASTATRDSHPVDESREDNNTAGAESVSPGMSNSTHSDEPPQQQLEKPFTSPTGATPPALPNFNSSPRPSIISPAKPTALSGAWIKFLADQGFEMTWEEIGSMTEEMVLDAICDVPRGALRMALVTSAKMYRDLAANKKEVDEAVHTATVDAARFNAVLNELESCGHLSEPETARVKNLKLQQCGLIPNEQPTHELRDESPTDGSTDEKVVVNSPPTALAVQMMVNVAVDASGDALPNDRPTKMVEGRQGPERSVAVPVPNTSNNTRGETNTIIDTDGRLLVHHIVKPDHVFDPKAYAPTTVTYTDPLTQEEITETLIVTPNSNICPHEEFAVKCGSTGSQDTLANAEAYVMDANGARTTLTGDSGVFKLPEGLPEGKATLHITAPGYEAAEIEVMIIGKKLHSEKRRNVHILKQGTGPAARLEWARHPSDLDLHYTRADGFHVYFAERDNTDGNLDRDDTCGNGCETISFKLEEGPHFFYVHHYSGEESMRVSDAHVTLTGLGPPRTIHVNPTLPFKGNKTDVWRVCRIDTNGEVTVVNDYVEREHGSAKYTW